jgi:hypothetical protein
MYKKGEKTDCKLKSNNITSYIQNYWRGGVISMDFNVIDWGQIIEQNGNTMEQ